MPECKVRTETQGKVRFGVFEADFETRELRKRGIRIKLEEKPFRVLQILIRASGGLVTRKQLVAELWPDLYVDFDRCLNTAVNALRRTLSDSPRNPRFLETKVGLGYRFVAPVEWLPSSNGLQRRAADDSVAVLLFENPAHDSELEYLARDVPENLIRTLSRLNGLRVVSRIASFRYGAGADVCAVARELNAGTVFSGRIWRDGDSIAIDVELAEVATGVRLWGELYRCGPGQLLNLETRIAREVASKLRATSRSHGE